MTYSVLIGTLNPTHSLTLTFWTWSWPINWGAVRSSRVPQLGDLSKNFALDKFWTVWHRIAFFAPKCSTKITVSRKSVSGKQKPKLAVFLDCEWSLSSACVWLVCRMWRRRVHWMWIQSVDWFRFSRPRRRRSRSLLSSRRTESHDQENFSTRFDSILTCGSL